MKEKNIFRGRDMCPPPPGVPGDNEKTRWSKMDHSEGEIFFSPVKEYICVHILAFQNILYIKKMVYVNIEQK